MIRDVVIRPAQPNDLAPSIKLLAEAGLPIADVSVERLALVAERNERLVGLIGLEQYAALGLLRSLVVDSDNRRNGLGRRLIDELERVAKARGICELWLLTIDADPYFERLGFSRQSRSAVPDVIAASDEFRSLCPDDAVLMRKAVGP